jgi:nucleoside-diphosphate-sugar epimerase
MSKLWTAGILGASGFIGSRLVEWLVFNNLAEVRPIVRSWEGMARLSRFNLETRIADGVNESALGKALPGCDVLFYCIVGNRDVILKSTEAAYRAAASAGVRRLVYLSSAVVHGFDPPVGTQDDSPLVLKQPFEYNVSKAMAEKLLRRLRVDGAVEVVTIRPSIVFGPRSVAWTAQIALDLLNGNAYLIDGGSGVCNTIYIDNLVEGMWLAAMSDRSPNQDFLIGDGERITWGDLYNAVAKAVGVEFSTVSSVANEDVSRIFKEQRQAQRRATLGRFVWAVRESLPFKAKATLIRSLPPNLKNTLKQVSAPFLKNKGSAMLGNDKRPFPALDLEIVNLQQCRYVLPINKAKEMIGYVPSVSFSEGCRRTAEWLQFAFGYKQ